MDVEKVSVVCLFDIDFCDCYNILIVLRKWYKFRKIKIGW